MNLIKQTITAIALSAVAISATAQDLLANHAPSDRKLTDLKAIKISKANSSIDLSNPAANIYATWDNTSALVAPGMLPANFKIDLRGFAMPTPSRKITSKFGPRWGKQHKGIDIKVYTGDTIYAAFDGKVRIAKFNAGGWGYYIVLRHPNGLETLYGHLSRQLVKEDQIVRAGQPIGLGGATGHVTGSHLHFETRLLGQAINPAFMFDFEAQDVTGDYYVVKNGAIKNSNQAPMLTTQASAPIAEKPEVVTLASRPQHEASNTPATTDNKGTTHESKTEQQPVTYVVKDGDNLFRIAQSHGLTLDQLCRLNGLKPSSLIVRGQVLKCS